MNAQLNAGTGVTAMSVPSQISWPMPRWAGLHRQGLGLNANAVDLSSRGAALAYANADIQGTAGVTLAGQTTITADLTTKTQGGGQIDIDVGDNEFQTMNYGWAFAGLTIDPR